MSQRHKAVPAVYAFLEKDGKLLLMRRFQTGYEDGNYSLPSGHVEAGEAAGTALRREVEEEVGVSVDPKSIQLAHCMYRRAENETGERIDLFFLVTNWNGTPQNLEPHKCDELTFFPLDNLPENIIPYVKKAIEHWQNGITFSDWGWD